VNHWPFIIGAYAAALGGTGGLVLLSWLQMRRAEHNAEAVRTER